MAGQGATAAAGFTLIEVLLAVSLCGLMAVIGIAYLYQHGRQGQLDRSTAQLMHAARRCGMAAVEHQRACELRLYTAAGTYDVAIANHEPAAAVSPGNEPLAPGRFGAIRTGHRGRKCERTGRAGNEPTSGFTGLYRHPILSGRQRTGGENQTLLRRRTSHGADRTGNGPNHCHHGSRRTGPPNHRSGRPANRAMAMENAVRSRFTRWPRRCH